MHVESSPLPTYIRFTFYFLMGSGVVALAMLVSHLPAFGSQIAGF